MIETVLIVIPLFTVTLNDSQSINEIALRNLSQAERGILERENFGVFSLTDIEKDDTEVRKEYMDSWSFFRDFLECLWL